MNPSSKYDISPLSRYIKKIETLVSPARHLPADRPGVITGGYGETDPRLVHEGMIVPEDLADAWLNARLAPIQLSVQQLVPFTLSQGQMIALMDFVYNLGLKSLKDSTLLKDILAGKLDKALNDFLSWDIANGKVLSGLEKRRHVEANWFAGKQLDLNLGS